MQWAKTYVVDFSPSLTNAQAGVLIKLMLETTHRERMPSESLMFKLVTKKGFNSLQEALKDEGSTIEVMLNSVLSVVEASTKSRSATAKRQQVIRNSQNSNAESNAAEETKTKTKNKTETKTIKKNTRQKKDELVIEEVKNEPEPTPKPEPKPRQVYTQAFERFYENYPIKRGKQAAFDVWKSLKITPELADKIINAVREQCRAKAVSDKNGIFCPRLADPCRFLKHRRWEDSTIGDISVSTSQKVFVSDDEKREIDFKERANKLNSDIKSADKMISRISGENKKKGHADGWEKMKQTAELELNKMTRTKT
jgi:hypothetical protein